MSEIIINNTAATKMLRDHRKELVELPTGKPVELSDEQIAGIEKSPAGKAHLAECARKRIPSEAQKQAEAAEKAAKVAAQAKAGEASKK